MVNWFNQTDVDYRTQLRDLNDRNYARFEAKLEQRFSEQDAKWEARFGALETAIERRFSEQTSSGSDDRRTSSAAFSSGCLSSGAPPWSA